ncbi:MAG: glycosyltransferase [Calditrichaeota bacterium]|nr:MAG: glycosyltransferase [Calditrichota bacterium]
MIRSKASNGNIDVSIIVPSYNSEKTIYRCLESVLAQKTRHSFEVILVDSSDDQTPEIVARHFPQVQLVHMAQKTPPGSARNIGMARAKGKIFAFTDSDCVVDEDWLDRLLESLQEKQVAVVFGSVKNGTPTSLVGTVSYYLEFNDYLPGAKPREAQIFLGGNVGIRRQILEKYNIRYNDFRASEDTLLAWTLVSKGEKIFFDPRIRVTHINRTEWRPMLRHQFILGQCSARARKAQKLYGQIFIKWPLLCLLLPFVRWVRAAGRITRASVKDLLTFAAVTPFYLIAGFYWSFGFMQVAFKNEQQT